MSVPPRPAAFRRVNRTREAFIGRGLGNLIYLLAAAQPEEVMGFTPTEKIWFNGKMVPWHDAKVHVLAHGLDEGVRVTISSVRKFPSNAMPATGKACGQYINSVRAVQDAQRRGFDEAILLNQRGEVSEGSGENVFVVKSGAVITNDADADILMGVTCATILELAKDLSIPTRVQSVTVHDLMTADE